MFSNFIYWAKPDFLRSYLSDRPLLTASMNSRYYFRKGQFTSVCGNKVISIVSDTGGICYNESLTTDMLDWNAATLNCSNTNRRLARVLNEEMSNEIERVTQDTDEYWIGLSRSNSNSEFVCSDGSSLSYTRWSSGHPMNELNCVSVRGGSTEWYSRDCNVVKPYVCETDVCVGWTVRNGICYKRFDDIMNADTAVSLCEVEKAYLAEIPNIYVDNIITEIIGREGGGEGNDYWTGLRTNETHYYWRIGDFPLGNDMPSNINECGAVDEDDGNRWHIHRCTDNRRAICMIGPLTNEFPIERCESSSANTLVIEDSCYTRITVDEENLDRATLTCTDYYNGALYTLDNTTVNAEIRDEFGNGVGDDLRIVDPEEYIRFTPQDGNFNLYVTYEQTNYPKDPDKPECVRINSDGTMFSSSSSSNCPPNNHNYICKRAKTTPTPTTNMVPTTSTNMDVLLSYESVVLEILNNIGNLSLGEKLTGFNDLIKAEITTVSVNSTIDINVTFGNVTVEINSDSFQGNPTIVVAVYQDIVNFTRFEDILSEVITIVASEELTGTLGIRFSILQNTTANFSCNSLAQNGTWVTDGIVTTVKGNLVLCITSHLTSFAVLIDPTIISPTSSVDDNHRQYQAYISVVLCGLSLVAMLTTIILYLCLGKKFYRKDINIIQFNFVIALSFALITFFLQTIPYFGIIELPPQACGAITFLTHYCWLSVFSWNFCQALHIILALFGNRLPFKRHYLPLMLIGWGAPIPIVIITLGVGLAQGVYQNADDICFLTAQNDLIWAFLGPIFFILVINTCIIIFIIIVSIYVQRRRRHKLAYSWRLVIGVATTIPLLGLPWIVGLLIRVIENTSIAFIVINYIFIIVNASQGLIFFIVHVIRNQEIRSLCSSNLKADIDIHPNDKEKKKERESIERKLRELKELSV